MLTSLNTWDSVLNAARTLRHRLHTHPELGWNEHKTSAVIRAELDSLGISWRSVAGTGTLATLAPDAGGTHIALRGDIDGLPIREKTGLDYASDVEGCMHACGHDGHTAALWATGAWLKQFESELAGPVTLLFQPAEEGGHGAAALIREGALDGIDCIYGWHNWPAISFGKIVCPDGLIMCGNGTFEITVTGRGGHASQPELCADPVLAASAIHVNLQQVVSRRLPPQKPAVLSVTSIEAKSAPTIIPDRAVLGGSIRVPDAATRALLNGAIDEVATKTAQAYGVQCEVVHRPRYEATINHAEPANRIREAWSADHGADAFDYEFPLPAMASEDFSDYLREIPGAFALIGADDGPDHRQNLHNTHYDFNDRLIEPVVQLYSRLAGVTPPLRTNP
ncbi:amidohydrolase [Coraliomargarita sinensis]|uniref:Amidohydrolase n=1 Tax=Coraliomargarita sinensis TaxID=2174842 RepID=A0A317ZJ81_9BACT|nr:N(2)-acetyl-L-2,4-diaminobutanoate deacetylase DoeB2 [Coraliomargarita sinensis]PXA03391.1 amidohydrolase [Coraliomargarita sinensis]